MRTRERDGARYIWKNADETIWATVIWEGELPREEQGWHSQLVSKELLCGRSIGSEAGLSLADKTVSEAHCRLFIEDGSYFVEDLGSTNGTHLNGIQVKKAWVGDSYIV